MGQFLLLNYRLIWSQAIILLKAALESFEHDLSGDKAELLGITEYLKAWIFTFYCISNVIIEVKIVFIDNLLFDFLMLR